MAVVIFLLNRPSLQLASAAAILINKMLTINSFGRTSSLILKLSTALCVCGPNNAFLGIFTFPMLSLSTLQLIFDFFILNDLLFNINHIIIV